MILMVQTNEERLRAKVIQHVDRIASGMIGFIWASDELGRGYIDSCKAARQMFADENIPDDIWSCSCIIAIELYETITKQPHTYTNEQYSDSAQMIAAYFHDKFLTDGE